MITTRGLWLALSAAVVAAVAIVVIARSRRRPTGRRAARQGDETSPRAATVAQWPPAPVLGTPTAEDLARYATRPSLFDRPAFTSFFAGGGPREPLNEAARRRLTRWGVAGLTLLLLAAGAQVLEFAVFSKETGGGTRVEAAFGFQFEDASCDEPSPDGPAPCFFATVGPKDAPAGDQLPADDQLPGTQLLLDTQPPVAEDASSPDADCLPGDARPRVRKPDPKVTRAVNRQWRRIEVWLKANAPRSYRTLGKPAKPEAIAAAEASTGLRFPDDLRASLLRHDGAVMTNGTWGFGFLGNSNMAALDIRDTWRGMCEIDGDVEFADPRMDWWDGRMLPFGASGTGDHLVIDSVKGDVGETDHEGSMGFTPGGVRIRSYHALLKATADALETGGSIGYWQPKAVAGELAWEVR
ncbi:MULTISPECIES: SMI1/KNR4 family protein [unclassified Nonomuraea]|uniref:SMI1/KNR4 family protein n=1 Tax=unclassified Nonomuraea TaxID=2593643 RepID=UPI0033D42F63